MSIATHFRLVDKNKLEQLHDATLDILAETGIVFQSDECLEIFKQHGAKIDGQTVFIPKDMVNKAIEHAPSEFRWEARNTDRSITLGAAQEGIHVSHNNGPIYIQDLDEGRRLGTMTDLINLYKLAQKSDTCSIVGQIPVEPADITHPLRYLDIFRQLLKHSDKPLFGYVGNTKEVGQMFDMVRISLGAELGDDSVFDQHRISVSLNPLSPLQFDEIPCETLLTYAKLRQPVMVLTCAMAGVTSPVDPLGTVVLQNAEILAGLTLAQLVNPGTPVVYSPASAIPNMRTASYITGSPISNFINMVGIQLARELYNIPSRCMAGLTDAKAPDCQAGYETMQTYLMLAMAGVNMVNECYGVLDAIMTVSYEKFIIDDEIMSRAACVMKGIDTMEPDFSKSIIQEIGHGGSYLMHPSTMKHCRGFWTPGISTMDSYETWEKKGSMDVTRAANAKFKEILAACPDQIIDPEIDTLLAGYIEAAK
ncbi:MAG: trimethylamine methyltransferase family protein [Desulfobacterales bacterium]|nr:trimethylamine methyltransferase family protein [Desulfobacterales bacterium]